MGTLHGLLLSLRAHGRGRFPCSSAEAKDRQSDAHPIHPIRCTDRQVIPVPSTRSQRRKGASALSTPVRCGS
jgi:hypothetical protein